MSLTITIPSTHVGSEHGALRSVYLASAAAMVNFFALLSVVPIHVVGLGGGTLAVSANTTAVMLACVAGELIAPRLAGRYTTRTTMTAALGLLTVPAAVSPLVYSVAATAVLGAVRGVGFGMIAVLGSATVARLAGPDHLAAVMGTYGVATGLPAVVALPVGVWVANTAGTTIVFIVAAAATTVGIAATLHLPSIADPSPTHRRWGDAFANITLTRAALVFAAAAAASGAVLTFLPVITTHPELTVGALFAHNGLATTSRWLVGRYDRRLNSRNLIILSIALSTIGVATLVGADHAVLQLVGMVVFGIGFGIAENTTVTVMYRATTPDQYPTASAMWNATYDAALGIGAFLFGVAATATSHRVAFAITAAVVAVSLRPAFRATTIRP